MPDMSRRRLFGNYFLKNAVRLIDEIQKSCTEVKTEIGVACAEVKSDLDYFDSFESAYPLISESAYFMEDEVARLKIDTKDMTQLEIVKEMYIRNKKNSLENR
jgi:hypothetical protein